MKRVCVLLNGKIENDARVIKTIVTISRYHHVDLYYTDGNEKDTQIFSSNVELHSVVCPYSSLKQKIIRHTVFYDEYLFFVKKVLEGTITYDYIWANDLPCLKPAVYLKKKTGAKLIYDSHEIYIETLNQFFPVSAPWFKNIIFKMLLAFMQFTGTRCEWKLIKDVDHFITVGKSLQRYFQEKYNLTKIHIMMNCPERDFHGESIDFHKMLNIDKNKFIVLYQGVLNYGRGLILLLEAFKHTNERSILVILGDGPLRPNLIEYSKLYNLAGKVFFIDKVPLKSLPKYTRGANCGINLLESINLSKKYAVPNKLFEYMHAGIPAITTKTKETELIFQKYNIGIFAKNEPKDIVKSIDKISDMDLSEYKKNCQKAALEYNWENQEKVILKIFE